MYCVNFNFYLSCWSDPKFIVWKVKLSLITTLSTSINAFVCRLRIGWVLHENQVTHLNWYLYVLVWREKKTAPEMMIFKSCFGKRHYCPVVLFCCLRVYFFNYRYCLFFVLFFYFVQVPDPLSLKEQGWASGRKPSWACVGWMQYMGYRVETRCDCWKSNTPQRYREHKLEEKSTTNPWQKRGHGHK